MVLGRFLDDDVAQNIQSSTHNSIIEKRQRFTSFLVNIDSLIPLNVLFCTRHDSMLVDRSRPQNWGSEIIAILYNEVLSLLLELGIFHRILVVSNDGVICGNEDEHSFPSLILTDLVVAGRDIDSWLFALLLKSYEVSVLCCLLVLW